MKTIYAADLFCGAGGTSTGLTQAAEKLGLDVQLLAINHWSVAISTHSANHPAAEHLCENLDDVDPRKVVPSGYLDLLVASPECTFHCRARGGRPIQDQSRASAWHILRWAEALYIENILVENVPEFVDWGPLDRENLPMQNLKGKTFLAFIEALRSLGYSVDYRVINTADYGDPTTRKRLFVMARREKPVIWPVATFSKEGGSDMLRETQKWRPAREIIDWGIQGESIFGRKKPLSKNTMKRIEAGLRKFSGLPFVIGQQSCAAPRSTGDPLPTIAGAGAIALVEPFILPNEGINRGNAPRSVDDPLPTITASRGGGHLVEPFLVVLNGTKENQIGGSVKSIEEPTPTVTGAPHIGVVEPFLVEYHGASYEGGERVRSVDQPMPTVATSNQYGLCEPFILGHPRGKQHKEDNVHSVEKPLPTITATSSDMFLVEPFLVKYNSTGGPESMDEPLDTVTAKDRFGLVVPLTDGRQAVLDIRFRMLQPAELAAAMSFPSDYQFSGNREQRVKQIGNAVPVRTAQALCEALLT